MEVLSKEGQRGEDQASTGKGDFKWKKLRTEQALPALGSFPLHLAGQANVDTGGTPYTGLLAQPAPSLSPVVSDA